MNIFSRLPYAPVYLMGWLPFFILHFLSDLSFLVLYHLLGYRKKVVRKNLEIAFPTKTANERLHIEKQFYRQFCDIILEISKLVTLSKSQMSKRYRITNPELIQQYFTNGKSIILYAAHLGNWEWFSALPTQINHQVVSLYQPLSNRYFDGMMRTIRSSFGMECVPSARGYRSIMEYARNNVLTLNLVIGDQSPGQNSPKHWINFFNQETAFLIGADRIAKKSNQAVIFPDVQRIKRGYYELTFIVITNDAKKEKGYDIMDKYAALLEQSIMRSPADWLWSHNRWKLKKENEASNS